MKYNICFTLGDPSGDGHANTSEYRHIGTSDTDYIFEYTIDGHDYIKKGYGMAHSGTCKKCKQERDSIVNVLIKELSAN